MCGCELRFHREVYDLDFILGCFDWAEKQRTCESSINKTWIMESQNISSNWDVLTRIGFC